MGTIVVGVDDSEAGRSALRWALAEADLRGDHVVALLAWQPVLTHAQARGPYYRPEVGDEVAHAVLDEALAAVAPEHRPDVELRAVVDDAADALVEAAREADLVVVGSHGRSGIGRLLFGSVSTQVAHHAPCPVVIVPEEEP